MAIKSKKLAVFHRLSQEVKSISIKELLEMLGSEYAERSVRRWLVEMAGEGLVQIQGRKRGTKYQITQFHSTKEPFCFQESSSDITSCFQPASIDVLKHVRRPVFERRPVAYADEWFDAYLPGMTFYIPATLRAEMYKAGKRSKSEDPAGTYAHQIYDRLLIDLSYNSSRLEGNTYSLLDTRRLILEGTDAMGKLDEEKIMILNHKEAIRYLVHSIPRLGMNKHTISTLHYLLADGLVGPTYAGRVRDHGVRIQSSTYIPSENPKWLELQLGRIIRKAMLIEDPYEQSIFLLIHISYLQAFSDVNKRTARLTANIPLVTHNLVPLSFNDVERDDYSSAMIAVYELQDVRPMVDLYAFSYLRSCVLYESTIKAINFDEIRVRYRQKRRSLLRDIIVNQLTGVALKDHLSSQTQKLIPKEDQDSFLEDAMEDLTEMNECRIVGMGISSDQLQNWIKKYRKG